MKKAWPIGRLGLIALAILALAGCAASSPAPAAKPGVHLAQDFQITLYGGQAALGGEKVLLSSVVSQGKPVVLNFYAGLCPPCRAEMPDIQTFSSQYHDRVTVVSVDIGPFVGLGSSADGKALVKELGLTYPTGTTYDGKAVAAYQILGMPTTVFLTPDGKVFKKWTGLLTRTKLVELANDLLASSPA
ncbi:MAG: TlpA family protein disulfide reductase [Chloroflexi bacterium]|nr:TlpA family protein disulfide reductase [Chloroflexota bacterium]